MDLGCVAVTEQSITTTNSGNEQVRPSTLPRPTTLPLGMTRELDKSEAWLLAGCANTVVEQTPINLRQEKPITQERKVWKREGERFLSGAGSWGGGRCRP